MNGVVATRAFLDQAVELWHSLPDAWPEFDSGFSPAAQAAREPEMESFLAALEAEVKRPPATRQARLDAHARISAAFARLARQALGFDGDQLHLLLDGGFASIGTRLARAARRFDPDVDLDDVLQASRNAWTACGLQLLYGRPMALTPSIFAYSMLYPYTDNYMDDATVPPAELRAFGERLARRLAGVPVEPANPAEQRIWRLVGEVEWEYPRAEFPGIYESLLEIHRAQCDSLRLRSAGGDVDVVRLSFAKGGASVLADAWLAAGTLTEEQARFAYLWGVVLQLGDDLQDLREDLASGTATVFTRAAITEGLDGVTARTLRLARMTMAQLAAMDCPAALKRLIGRSSVALIIRSAGEAAEHYSAAARRDIEAQSPFRSGYLSERRKRLNGNSGAVRRLFEAFLAGGDDEPAFPYLPASLMPRV